MSDELRANIGLVLDALTALGTLAAVWAAVYFARAERKEVVKLRASARVMVTQGGWMKDGDRCVMLSATNLTHRPVTITGIGWRVGYIRPKSFIQLPPVNQFSWKIPSKIEYGECANFIFYRDDFLREFDTIAKHIDTRLPWLSKRYIRFVVSTSGSSTEFTVVADDTLTEDLISAAEKLKKKK
jgi:hypothetical protein